MSPAASVLYDLVFLFFVLLVVRVVMEAVIGFARSWEPTGVVLVLLEAVFTVTDPPVKALRRVIPPLRVGQIAFDLAVMVLFVILLVLMQVLRSF